MFFSKKYYLVILFASSLSTLSILLKCLIAPHIKQFPSTYLLCLIFFFEIPWDIPCNNQPKRSLDLLISWIVLSLIIKSCNTLKTSDGKMFVLSSKNLTSPMCSLTNSIDLDLRLIREGIASHLVCSGVHLMGLRNMIASSSN